jgi:hypothetical protein
MVKALGADKVIDYRKEDVMKRESFTTSSLMRLGKTQRFILRMHFHLPVYMYRWKGRGLQGSE